MGEYILRCPCCTAVMQEILKVQGRGALAAALEDRREGPVFLHVMVRPGDAPVQNIPLSPLAIRDRFTGTGRCVVE
jgi:hypothetical protein